MPDELPPTPRRWKRWQKALLGSAIWSALTIGAAIVHTSVFAAGKLTEAQDEEISERYGMACGAGLVAILAVIFLRKQREE
jgi:hypothetical protein